jgi:hypothetical protein
VTPVRLFYSGEVTETTADAIADCSVKTNYTDTKRRTDFTLTPLLIPNDSAVDYKNAVVNRPHLGRFTDWRDITWLHRKVLLSSLLLVYWAIIQTFNLLHNSPKCPVVLFNSPKCPVESDWGYESDNNIAIPAGCWSSKLSAQTTRWRNTITIMTRTQSPILTINQLVRPLSIVYQKKEAVTAVTQTKIMLQIVLLFICLLIPWSVPRQLRHVAHDPKSVASWCLQKTNPLSVLFRDPYLCESYQLQLLLHKPF